jgi:hypothetical protein
LKRKESAERKKGFGKKRKRRLNNIAANRRLFKGFKSSKLWLRLRLEQQPSKLLPLPPPRLNNRRRLKLKPKLLRP